MPPANNSQHVVYYNSATGSLYDINISTNVISSAEGRYSINNNKIEDVSGSTTADRYRDAMEIYYMACR